MLSFIKGLKWKKQPGTDLASEPVGLPQSIVSKEEDDSQQF